MKRIAASMTALLAAGASVMGAGAARAAEYVSTIGAVQASWVGSTVRIAFSYDTWEYGRVDVSVGGQGATSKVLESYDRDDAAITVTRAVTAGAAPVTVTMVSCDQDPGVVDDAVCASTVAFRGTLRPVRPTPEGKADALVLLDRLTVRNEAHSASYARSRFKVWNDADRDGEDTRAEVLKAESRVTASVNRSGTVQGGKWISVYDNRVLTKASRLDVDHVVPLAEAWASGASGWSARRREAFGNDLGYAGSLVAVSIASNRSKGDRDPSEWMPPSTADTCAYAKTWIAVKTRWHLSIDRAEKAALVAALGSCTSYAVAKPGTPDIAKLTEPAKPAKPVGRKPGGSTSHTYYANCAAVRAAGAAPLYAGQPGYETPRLDRDGDGVACE